MGRWCLRALPCSRLPPGLSSGLRLTPAGAALRPLPHRDMLLCRWAVGTGPARVGKGCGRGTGVGPALAEGPPALARVCLTVSVRGLPLAGSPDFTLVLFLPRSPLAVLACAWAPLCSLACVVALSCTRLGLLCPGFEPAHPLRLSFAAAFCPVCRPARFIAGHSSGAGSVSRLPDGRGA